MSPCNFDWTIASAWVQAIGSVLAIVAAIWIGKSSERRARELVIEERDRQALMTASTLCTKLELIQHELEGSSSRLKSFLDDGVEYLLQMTTDQYRRFIIPPHLKHVSLMRAQVLQFDEPTGRLALDLIDSLEAHAEASERFLHGLESYKELPADLENLVTQITKSMTRNIGYISQARPAIQARYGLGAP